MTEAYLQVRCTLSLQASVVYRRRSRRALGQDSIWIGLNLDIHNTGIRYQLNNTQGTRRTDLPEFVDGG